MFEPGKVPTAETITGVLSLVDVSLLANLVLMVAMSGYEHFISRIDGAKPESRPAFLGTVGFGELKLKLSASIVIISGISLLELFMTVRDLDDRTLAWGVGMHLTFVVSAFVLAVTDRITSGSAGPASEMGNRS